MKPTELLSLLYEFYRDKLALFISHEAAARQIGQYDFNNTYQNIIGREEVHLSWVAAAIRDVGGTVEAEPDRSSEPVRPSTPAEALFKEDAARAQAFVDAWRDRIERITHARHREMLRLALGETLEHKRFFDQAAAGRFDLLGRDAEGAGQRGRVLATRWIE